MRDCWRGTSCPKSAQRHLRGRVRVGCKKYVRRSSMDIIYKVVSSPLSYALPFLFVLSLVVFFHELGHFLVARWCGIRWLVFSIGFGPELFGFNDRKGTRWKISAVPLGGYVKFLGDENAASVPDTAVPGTTSPAARAPKFFHTAPGGA